MYLSHERGRKGSHHRFITEKRVFKNWARTFNIHFFQPDWKPESPAVNHAEGKPVFWGVNMVDSGVHAVWQERKDLNSRQGNGNWMGDREERRPSAPWTDPSGQRTFQNAYMLMSVVSWKEQLTPWFCDTAMARNTPGLWE